MNRRLVTLSTEYKKTVARGGAVLTLVLMVTSSCVFWPGAIEEDVVLGRDDLDTLLDTYTDSHVDAGSNMELLIDGPASRAAFEELILSAEDHIHIETLNFDDDRDEDEDVALAFAEMLIGKAREGVDVNVIVDPIGMCLFSTPHILDVLVDGGVNVIQFVAPFEALSQRLLYRTHKKILIADGTRAIVGGMNYGAGYFGQDRWRDTNVLLTGPVVASVQHQFLEDWRALGGLAEDNSRFFPVLESTGDLAIRYIDQRPWDDDFDVNTAVQIALQTAEQRIDLETPYFNPAYGLLYELIDASQRGVDVRILTNSSESETSGAFPVMAYFFETLLDHGIRVFLWDCGAARTLHSKVVVVDDCFAMVGSYNFNSRSSIWDAENAVIFTDPQPVGEISAMLDNDFDSSCADQISDEWLEAWPEDERQFWDLTPLIGWVY